MAYNSGYADLQEIVNTYDNSCNYESVGEKLKNVEIKELANRARLSTVDYTRLIQSSFIDECRTSPSKRFVYNIALKLNIFSFFETLAGPKDPLNILLHSKERS